MRTISLRSAQVGQKLKTENNKYLLGEKFSAADLTFASLASVLIMPTQLNQLYQFDKCPIKVQKFATELRNTTAGHHVLRCYSQHRFAQYDKKIQQVAITPLTSEYLSRKVVFKVSERAFWKSDEVHRARIMAC